ncbi:MAG: class B sortase [Oscillospiraceae bacterium]|jgi:sortase B|nr:class B sortase [Oscillospiraceae bacterium]
MLTGTKKKMVFILASVLLALSLSGGCPFRKNEKEEVVTAVEDTELKEDMIARPVLQPKLKAAREKYPDAAAWIYIPGTNIDYPVMKSEKNYSSSVDNGRVPFYHRHAEDGSYRVSGSIYALHECDLASRKTLSRNTVVAGHNMEDGTSKDDNVRLAQLEKFYDINFAYEHPYIFLSIPDEDLVFEIFAVYITDVPYRGYGAPGFFYYLSDFPDETPKNPKDRVYPKGGDGSIPVVIDEKYGVSWIQNIAREAKLRSLYNYEVSVGKNSKVLTVTTCTYKYGKTGSPNCKSIEFVVQGKLLPASKKLYDKAQFFSRNENPKPPQGLPNPNVDYVYRAEGELPEEIEAQSDKELEGESGEIGKESDGKED